MGVSLPSFDSLGFQDPRAAGGLPTYPQEDPGAQGLAVLGKGAQQAGGAAEDFAAESQRKRDKVNEAMATADLFNRLVPLEAQITKETDPAKVSELKGQYRDILDTSSQAIDNPYRRQLWTATHSKTIATGEAQADLRNTSLYRDQFKASVGTQIDTTVRNGAGSDDPMALPNAKMAVDSLLTSARDAGAISAEEAYTLNKRSQTQLVEGTVLRLTEQGKADQAKSLLEQHRTDLDAITYGNLSLRVDAKSRKIGTDTVALESLGLPTTGMAVGSLPSVPTSSPAMSTGGAIPQRIAAEAQSQGVDPTTALATAQIESSMGRNLGSRGNIFQLGKPEWASVGGGAMGQPDTDIKNGVAFLARTQQQLEESLGRPANPAEIYLAHQQGVGGATKLLANPDTPAGELVPPRNISANGGDPNAPASAFVGKIGGIFQRIASRIGPAQAAPDQLADQAAPSSQPPQSRTGLPSLTDAYMNILKNPRITSDEQVRSAFQTATAIHNAMEADASRAERLAAQQQKQAMEQHENAIWADVYGAQPKITAQQIAVDPAFNGNPERRKQMIELINNPPGSGVPAAQSYAAALSLVDRIRLPEGNPDKITDEGQIYGQMRSMNRTDFEYVRKTLNDIRAPGGEAFAKEEDRFFKDIGPYIDKSNPLAGAMDPAGKARLYEYHRWVDTKKDDLKKAGKNPNDLFDPASPSYVGKPEIISYYQPSLQQSQQSLKDFATGVPKPLAPLAPWNPPPPIAPFTATGGRQPGETADDYLKRTGQQ